MKDKIIEKKDIKKYAKKLLIFLKSKKVRTPEDLEKILRPAPKEMVEKEGIYIEKRPSEINTFAYTVSYIVPYLGIPVEVKVNTMLDYSQIIFKSDFDVDNYLPFAVDPFGNVVKSKFLHSKELPDVKKELETLVASCT